MGSIPLTSATRMAETLEILRFAMEDAKRISGRDGTHHLDDVLSRQFGGLKHIDLYESRQRNEELAYGFFNFLATVIAPEDTAIHKKALRYCLDNGYIKAMGEGLNQGGGALVPAEFDRLVIRLVERFS